MAASPELRQHVLDFLEGMGPVAARRMFGGAGIYLDGVMFALLTGGDVLYFRTDGGNRARFEDAGMEPFVPFADGRMTMPYHRAPPEVMEDADEMCDWGRSAWEAAKRNRKQKPAKKKAAKKKGAKK